MPLRHPLAQTEISTLNNEEVVDHAIDLLGRDRSPAACYGEDGDLTGLVYFADETRLWYCVDLDDCEQLLRYHVWARDDHHEGGDEARATVYSRWCADSQPLADSDTLSDVLFMADWSCPTLE